MASSEIVIPDATVWSADNVSGFDAKAEQVVVLATDNEDVRSLRELIVYGLKGLAAYMKHAMNLGYNDIEVHGFMAKALAATLDDSLSAYFKNIFNKFDAIRKMSLECNLYIIFVYIYC